MPRYDKIVNILLFSERQMLKLLILHIYEILGYPRIFRKYVLSWRVDFIF